MKQIKYFSSFLLLLLQLNISAQSVKGKMLVGKVKEEQFGRNVKISADGNILAVAAPLNSEYGDQNGRISVYAYNGNDWQMMGKEILPGKGDFRYGEIMELSADGRKLFAASPFGGVSVYTYHDSNWVKSEHTIQLESNYDHIKSISITPDADKIAIMFESDKLRRACIKLFDYDGRRWVQDGIDLVPYPDEIVRRLSLSFSADGNKLAVGHYGKDTRRYKNAGEVIIYAKNAGEWKQQAAKFNGESSRANLGNEVLFSKNGNTIIASSAGSDLLDANAGFVETYKLSGTEWTKLPSAIKPAKYNPWFAHAVSLSADGIIVAISAPYIGFAKPGYVKVYKIKSDGWQEIAMLTDVDGVEKTSPANNTVGWSIALSADGKTLAIGFPHNDENGDMAGKVMVYDLSGVIK
jgi:WD40 repeat protein